MFFRKRKKNKNKKYTSSTYKSCLITKAQMTAISDSVIGKRRLFVYSESI